jgi:hypothetical protein
MGAKASTALINAPPRFAFYGFHPACTARYPLNYCEEFSKEYNLLSRAALEVWLFGHIEVISTQPSR